ncbi:hypothetical protein TW95_gp1575 [Pandoravirus inopinatum]|uniref:Uncharacterized protein n=1 Tax=Pandoravirus inopinatum TaxID=1605721 RepID=A0A0B5J3X8_9VIRU|nr:hypothetical protein TW95_gp1575 [Pandoravirus inopinatum]AJF98309.1 hypothetical protein [Pandoravirus inopinatum]
MKKRNAAGVGLPILFALRCHCAPFFPFFSWLRHRQLAPPSPCVLCRQISRRNRATGRTKRARPFRALQNKIGWSERLWAWVRCRLFEVFAKSQWHDKGRACKVAGLSSWPFHQYWPNEAARFSPFFHIFSFFLY